MPYVKMTEPCFVLCNVADDLVKDVEKLKVTQDIEERDRCVETLIQGLTKEGKQYITLILQSFHLAQHCACTCMYFETLYKSLKCNKGVDVKNKINIVHVEVGSQKIFFVIAVK